MGLIAEPPATNPPLVFEVRANKMAWCSHSKPFLLRERSQAVDDGHSPEYKLITHPTATTQWPLPPVRLALDLLPFATSLLRNK